MSHQAAAVVASTGIISEHNSNLHHQSPSQIHLQLSGSPVRDWSATTQNPVSDGNFVPGSSALPAPARLARDALHHEFSSARSAMSPLTSETMNTAAQATMQSDFSEQAGESDMSASTQELHEGPPPSSKSPDNTVDTQGSLGAAGEERTVTLPGQKCLRGTPSQHALLALIEEHVEIPNAVNPSLQTMELTDKILPFYDTTTRPPDHNPYIPTYEDIQELILPILKNGKITVGNKCITILRNVDDWYGSKGYDALRTAPKPENDSALGDMSKSFQTPSLSGNPDSGVFHHEKRPAQPLSTELPAKRLRVERIANSNESEAAYQIPIVSPDYTEDFSISSQNRSQDVLQPKTASGLVQKVRCLEEGCITSIKGRRDMKGVKIHYTESHFPTKVFLCPEPGCYEGFIRRERFFGEDGHFYKQHNYPINDRTLWAELQSKTVPTAIDDIFHDVCPRCEVYVKHETYQQYADHRDEHLKGKLTNHPWNHLCSEETHHWTLSHCIPEEYRRKLDGKKKPGKSCIDPALGSHKDQDSNGGGPPGPFGPGSIGPHGHQGPPWGRNERGNDAGTNDPKTYAGGYHYQSSCQPSLEPSIFLRLSGNLDSRLQVPSRASSRTSIPGINLIKKCFETVRKLGRGGFGTVDEVRCKFTKKLYARKIIPLSHSKTKFPSEVEILKQLHHQHIINLDAYCITSDQLWLFMTPVAEKDLATYLRSDASCSIGMSEREYMRKWESCLASALKYLHGNGLVHGDIKPQNILISSDMRIYLADFGSSRARYLEAGAGIEAKPPSALTPKYSAPEMFYYKSVGYSWQMRAAADVFSLGCVWAEIETVYTGLSIQVFETFRSGGGAYNSFQANLPMTYAWLDFIWALQESVLHTSRCWTYGTSSLQTAKEMLSYDPHQRPSADQLTDHHCNCSIDIPVLRGHEFLHDRHSSAIAGKVHQSSAYFEIDDASLPSQINTKLEIKPSSCWEVATEGFSPSGRIDASFSWDTSTPKKCSSWLAGVATSAAPLCGGKTRDYEPLPDLPKFHILEGDQIGYFDVVIGKHFLQTETQQLGAVIERPHPHDARPMNVKDLDKFQRINQHLEIQERLEFDRSYLSEPRSGFLSLEDYFRSTSPPSSLGDTIKLWDSALDILVLCDSGLGTPLSRQEDMKPDNILIYKPDTKTPYDWMFKVEDLGLSHFQSITSCSSEKDDGERHSSPDTPEAAGYAVPEASRSASDLKPLRISPSSAADIWSLGCLLLNFTIWLVRGWDDQEPFLLEGVSEDFLEGVPWSSSSPKCTNYGFETDARLRNEARISKQNLLESLRAQPDSLTKSIAESVIAPMLEPPDKQPSLNWLRENAQTLLDGARDSLNGYKKTVRKAATPVFSLVKSRMKGTCISSTLATDGRSDSTELLDLPPENEAADSDVAEDDYHKDADIDPNIFKEYSSYSYCLERYLRDKSDSRYLFPARGCDKLKELDKINLGNAIERFERLFISVA